MICCTRNNFCVWHLCRLLVRGEYNMWPLIINLSLLLLLSLTLLKIKVASSKMYHTDVNVIFLFYFKFLMENGFVIGL